MSPTRQLLGPLLVSVAMIIAGCSSPGTRKGGGYYQDDGPGSDIPADIDKTPDAIPRIEPLASGANRPYTVLGKNFVPVTDPDRPYKARGLASWYGRKFHGNNTSIGEPYDMYAMTAAHPTMPLPSYARVTSRVNGRTVIVRVNDRGPFLHDRIMDLSYAAAHKLGLIGRGSGEVTVERILPAEIRLAQSQGSIVIASGVASPIAESAAVSSTPVAASTLTITELAPVPAPTSFALLAAGTPAAGIPASAATATLARPATTPMSGPSGGIYLQMGAFSQPANAQALVQQVNRQLAEASTHATAVVHQNGALYRVRLGPYVDRAMALNVAQHVADRTGIVPSLVMP